MSSEKIKEVKAASEDAVETARDEIEAVKAHLERLITKHIMPALTNAGSKAENLTDQAVANAKELANHARQDISKQTRGPSSLVSIAISGVVGFILGRLSR